MVFYIEYGAENENNAVSCHKYGAKQLKPKLKKTHKVYYIIFADLIILIIILTFSLMLSFSNIMFANILLLSGFLLFFLFSILAITMEK